MASFPDVEILPPESDQTARVLLVSLRENWIRSVQSLIRTDHCRVAEGLASAITAIRRSMPDLIISDLALSDATCSEMCRRLKAEAETSAIPVLVISSLGIDDPAVLELIEAGADDYFRLGAPALLVHRRIERLLTQSRDRRRRRQVESRYQTLIESLPEIVYTAQARPPYQIIYLSPQARTLGYSLEGWREETSLWINLIHPHDRERVLEEIRSARERKGRFETEYRVVACDGSVLWIHDRSSLLLDKEGEPACWQGLLSDITERKRAEEKLRRSEERYRAFVEQSSEAIWCFEFEKPLSARLSEQEQIDHAYRYGYLAECNDAMARMYGLSRADEIIGARLKDMLIPSEPQNIEYLRAFIRSGYQLINAETREADKDGNIRYFLNNLVGIVEDGVVARAWGLQRDVTESRQMEEALRDSERRFRLLIEGSSDIITILTGDGVIRYESPSIERILGYKPEDMIGRSAFDLMHPDDARRTTDAVATSIKEGRSTWSVELRVLHKDGTWRMVESVGANLIDDPAIGGIIVNSRDITERKHTEEALRLARFTIDSAPDAIVYLGADGSLLFVNDATCRTVGYSREELLRMKAWDIDTTCSRENWPYIWNDFKTSNLVSLQTRYRTKDGRVLPIEISRFFLEFGGREYMCAFARDITERKQMEAALRRSESDYRNLFENANDSIIIFEPESEIILEANKMACETYGFSREEFIGMSLKLITKDVKRGEQRIREMMETGYAKNFETINFRKDGTPIHILGGGSLIEYRGKTAVMAIARDITEVKKLQQQLIQADKLAALGQMIAGVAHELNNPLTSVIGFTQLILMESSLNEQMRENLEIVRQEAERTRRIVQNLLSFSRQHKPSRTEVDINELLDRTLDLRAYEMSVNNISIRRNYGLMPSVMADEHQMQQVFLNIIINAEHAMHSQHLGGTLTLATSFEKSAEGNTVKIIIEDDGPGIAPENLDRLFDPFFTTKPVGKGTGLGLSISYGIIKEHGGSIRAESSPGQGARFIIELPLRPA
ncbi:MAG: PAS domain S-box protein [Acidobacteriota bacterium]